MKQFILAILSILCTSTTYPITIPETVFAQKWQKAVTSLQKTLSEKNARGIQKKGTQALVQNPESHLLLFQAGDNQKDIHCYVHGTGSVVNEENIIISRFIQPDRFPMPTSTTLFGFFWPSEIPHFGWSGLRRVQAGRELAQRIDALQKDYPNANIQLIGHSHGGNVVNIAVNAMKSTKPVTLIELGTPIKTEDLIVNYAPKKEKVARLINIVSYGDYIQPIGTAFSQLMQPNSAQSKTVRLYGPEHGQEVYNVFIRDNGKWPLHCAMNHPEYVELVQQLIDSNKLPPFQRNIIINIDTSKGFPSSTITHIVPFQPDTYTDIGKKWDKWYKNAVQKVSQEELAQAMKSAYKSAQDFKEKYTQDIFEIPQDKVNIFYDAFEGAAKLERNTSKRFEMMALLIQEKKRYLIHLWDTFVEEKLIPAFNVLAQRFATNQKTAQDAIITELQHRFDIDMQQEHTNDMIIKRSRELVDHTKTLEQIDTAPTQKITGLLTTLGCPAQIVKQVIPETAQPEKQLSHQTEKQKAKIKEPESREIKEIEV